MTTSEAPRRFEVEGGEVTLDECAASVSYSRGAVILMQIRGDRTRMKGRRRHIRALHIFLRQRATKRHHHHHLCISSGFPSGFFRSASTMMHE